MSAEHELRSLVPAPLADGAVSVRSPADLDGVSGDAVVLAFGLLDPVADFGPIVERLRSLADGGATVVLSVPNQAFAGEADGPIVWGEGAFEELVRLLPAGAVVGRVVELSGVALAVEGSEVPAPSGVSSGDSAPVAMLVAFGPRASALSSSSAVGFADRSAARRHERELQARIAVLEARLSPP